MGVLKDFESRLERGIEGFFKAAFRSGLQPVELAKRILREMERSKNVGVRDVWVPNRYTLRISQEDRERFANMEGALIRELENAVVEGARENGYALVARPEVVFDTDDGLKRGDVEIDAELTEATGPPDAAAPRTADRADAALVLPDDSKEWPISGDRAVIGRLSGSEVELQDPGASRRHAEVRRRGDEYVVVDLGSTNGTLLNDSPVKEATLADGDRITIGRTVLEFRRR